MQLGLIGLGKMGGNMRERLRRAGHEVVGYDRNPAVSDVRTMAAMVKALDAPRVVWVMVPSGAPTRETIAKLGDLMDKGDLIIDGGNSRFTDDIENARAMKAKGISYLDCGVSGGIWGLQNGYGLMVGGDKRSVARAMPIFDVLRPEGPREEGFVHAGEVGAGHYTKMVHNGIEYGLMAAYAEGYELLEKKDIVKDVPGAFKAWSRGTVVRSWLLDLAVEALEANPTLDGVSDYTVDSGEGKWTVEEAIALDVPMPVISASLFARFASRQKLSPTMQMVSALRGQFGGHQVMTIAEGQALRDAGSAGDADPTPGMKVEAKKREEAPHMARTATHHTATKGAAKKTSATKAATKPTKAATKTATKSAAKKAATTGAATKAAAPKP